MRDIFFEELKNINILFPNSVIPEKEKEKLKFVVKEIIGFSNIARKEGLLSLEEAAGECKKDDKYPIFNRCIGDFIIYIVDGTDPTLVEELMFTRYFTLGNISKYDSLTILMAINGILAIQAGENPRIIEERLFNMLPVEIVDEITKEKEEKRIIKNRKSKTPPVDLTIVKKICSEEAVLTPADDYYYIVNLLEEMIKSLDDRAIQRVLRDVDNVDLSLALKILNKESKQSIFKNLSEKLAAMIAEDMEFLGPVRLCDAGEACTKIYIIILKLIETCEIVSSNDEILKQLAILFLKNKERDDNEGLNSEIQDLEKGIRNLWNEYSEHKNRIITFKGN